MKYKDTGSLNVCDFDLKVNSNAIQKVIISKR